MSRVVRVTDFATPELDIYARTTENQLVCREDPENGKFIAETPMVIERALDAGYVPISFLMEEKYLENQGIQFCTGTTVNSSRVFRMTTRRMPALMIMRRHMEQDVASCRISPVRASWPAR